MGGGPEARSERPVAPAIDWQEAARLLADGLSIRATADRVGCSRGRLSRKKNSDETFKAWIEGHRRAARAQQGDPDRGELADPEPHARLAGLRDAVHRAIEAEVRKGNVRVILWLADRLKLVSEPHDPVPQSQLDRVLRDLSPAELEEFRSLQDTP